MHQNDANLPETAFAQNVGIFGPMLDTLDTLARRHTQLKPNTCATNLTQQVLQLYLDISTVGKFFLTWRTALAKKDRIWGGDVGMLLGQHTLCSWDGLPSRQKVTQLLFVPASAPLTLPGRRICYVFVPSHHLKCEMKSPHLVDFS